MFKEFISAVPKNKTQHSRILSWISILIAGLFLYLALRELDGVAFVASLRNVNYGFIPFIFIWSSINSWVRAFRWRVLLSAEKYIPVQNVFWANMAGYLGNNILPARAGELIRAAYVGRENNLSVSYSLATGLVERFVDLIALVILGSFALTLSGILSGPLENALKVMSVFAIVGLVLFIVLPYLGGILRRILAALPILSTPVQERIGGLLEQFLHGTRALHHPRRATTFLLLTSLIWLMDGIGTIILARAFHLHFTLTISFLLIAGLGLSSAIPSTPGYVGIYQFVAVVILQPFGFSTTTAVAFIVFLQVLSLLLIAFWGGLATWRLSLLAHPTS